MKTGNQKSQSLEALAAGGVFFFSGDPKPYLEILREIKEYRQDEASVYSGKDGPTPSSRT